LPSAVEVSSAYEGAGAPCDGVYVFSSALNLRKGLEIRDSECELREIDGSRAQQFRLEPVAHDGCYWIISMQKREASGCRVSRALMCKRLFVNVSLVVVTCRSGLLKMRVMTAISFRLKETELYLDVKWDEGAEAMPVFKNRGAVESEKFRLNRLDIPSFGLPEFASGIGSEEVLSEGTSPELSAVVDPQAGLVVGRFWKIQMQARQISGYSQFEAMIVLLNLRQIF